MGKLTFQTVFHNFSNCLIGVNVANKLQVQIAVSCVWVCSGAVVWKVRTKSQGIHLAPAKLMQSICY